MDGCNFCKTNAETYLNVELTSDSTGKKVWICDFCLIKVEMGYHRKIYELEQQIAKVNQVYVKRMFEHIEEIEGVDVVPDSLREILEENKGGQE